MSPKIQIGLIGVLALAVSGVYAKIVFHDDASEALAETTSVEERAQPLVRPPSELRELVASALSNGLFDKGHWRGRPALADLNGDGHLDLVASIRVWEHGRGGEGIYVWLGDGAGNWKVSNDGLPRDLGYGGARIADANGDGFLDIAFSCHDEMAKVFLGDGLGRWQDASSGIVTTGPSADVALGDIEGDGRAELVTIGQFSPEGGVHVFRADAADGAWSYADELLRDAFGDAVRMLDLDADGTLEVLATTELGPRVWRFEDGNFVDMSAGLPTPEVGGADNGLGVRDLDGDGFGELLISGMIYKGHDPLRVFRWNGEIWERWGTGLPADEAFFDVEFFEVDGEGDTVEFVAAGKHGLQVVGMVEPGVFRSLGRVNETMGVVNLTTGDVNGDGLDEVITVGFRGVQVLDISDMFEDGDL